MKRHVKVMIILITMASLLLSACGTEAVSVSEGKAGTEVKNDEKDICIKDNKENETSGEDNISDNYDIIIDDDELYSSYATYPEGIVCWGDSLTVGHGGDGVTYPDTLHNLLLKDGLDIPVVNMGASGEDTSSIAGRSGAIPFLTTNDIYIPEDPTPIEVHLVSSNGMRVFPSIFTDVGINECFIGGVGGTLTKWVQASNDADYTFVRTERGDAVSVPAGSEVVTEASLNYRNYISIVFMGTNGGFKDYNDLIEQQNAIINSRDKDTDRFLIIGITEKTAAEYAEYDAVMKEYYGNKFLDLRDYLVNHALDDAGITPTEADLECIAVGMVPESIRIDEVHLNAKGYELMGIQVYNRLMELGYFNVEE